MRPLRVLHVLGSLVRGGVESWLMHVVRRLDRQRVQCDFAVHSSIQGLYDEEVKALGSQVIQCGSPHALRTYIPALLGVLRQHGPYDVVHSHVLHFSGVVLAVARAAGVPGRIAHSHSDTRPAELGAGAPRRAYLALATALVNHTATDILACSGEAAIGLLGTRGLSDPRVTVLPYGIDLTPFQQVANGAELRRAHGIPPGVPVFGHVGRMAPEKNHRYVLDVARATLALVPEARFVLIGDGPLKGETVARTADLGLSGSIVFPDPSTDVPSWLTGVFDAFVFPSLFEGVPIALIEAQAAGLPCVVSLEAITPAVDVIPSLLYRLSLDDGAHAWARVLIEAIRSPRLAPSDAVSTVATTAFDIRQNLRTLERLYERRARWSAYVAQTA